MINAIKQDAFEKKFENNRILFRIEKSICARNNLFCEINFIRTIASMYLLLSKLGISNLKYTIAASIYYYAGS